MKTTLVRLTDRRLAAVTLGHEIWTSLEGENPGGSIKDRMVVAELTRALDDRQLVPGDTVAEISAGSTALSLGFHAKRLGLACVLFVPIDLDTENKMKLEALGVELHFCDPASAYLAYEEFCAKRPVWRLDQMKRPELRFHYEAWARADLAAAIKPIDCLVAAVGTGHSLLGLKNGLNPRQGAVTAEPLEARLVHGIRNLEREKFGNQDPCDPRLIEKRIELEKERFFPYNHVETDQGKISISDSFRVVLGAVEHIADVSHNLIIFAVGSHNRR